jgi:hypothetical protein
MVAKVTCPENKFLERCALILLIGVALIVAAPTIAAWMLK